MFTWSFLVIRSDGTICMLRPNLANNKAELYERIAVGNLDAFRNRLGGSDGKGYFHKRISKQITQKLRFDKSGTPLGVSPAVIQNV